MFRSLSYFFIILFLISLSHLYSQYSRIFWVDQGAKKIQSAYLNGKNITDVVTNVESVEGIALDTTVNPMKIYYCESGLSRIMRANFDGTDTERVVTDISGLQDIDLDLVNRKVFWLTNTFNDDRVQSADMDSLNSNIKDLYKASYVMHDFRGIALDTVNHKVYWSQSVYGGYDRISRINYDGTGKENVVSINYVRDIDIIGNMIYWIRGGSSLLIRSDLEVSYLDTLVTDVNSLFFCMDTSLGMAFWTGKLGTGQQGRIIRAKLDNTDTREIVTGLSSSLTSIALYYNPDFNTAIEEDYNVPVDYVLFQNYPNPFNPVTTINYEIPKRSEVSIKIYDITGRLVTTLVDDVKNAGQHTAIFRANKLSSGVYFYRLQAGSYSAVKRMMLLK